MNKIVFRLNPQSAMPHLVAVAGLLEEQHQSLEREIRSRYKQLIHAHNHVVQFNTVTKLSPTGRFKVVVVKDTARLPTLVFYPVKATSNSNARCLEGLIEPLMNAMAENFLYQDEDDDSISTFDSMIEQLEAQAKRNPLRIALMLLKEFLAGEERMARGDQKRLQSIQQARTILKRLNESNR